MELKKVQPFAPKTNAPQNEVVAQEVPSSEGIMNDLDKAMGKQTIIHGANEVQFDVTGKTAGYVRKNLTKVLNIPDGAAVLFDGEVVNDETVIGANVQTLEFIKSSGVKGKI